MRIVFLMVDSMRADAPGFAGGDAKTPALDAMAGEGAAAGCMVSCSPWTVPSVAAMMTGAYAHRLGLYRWEQPWPDQFPTVFRAFSAAGYQVASFVFDPKHLFRRVAEAGVAGTSQDLDAVVAWLAGCTSPDLFLFVHYWGTHFPYIDRPMTMRAWKKVADRVLGAMNESPRDVRPKVRGLYLRAIERMSERFLPRLVEAAGKHAGAGGTLLVVVSDHGESWGERLGKEARLGDVFDLHGNALFEESIRVPCVFWGPPWTKGRRVSGLTRTVDIAPTLLEAAGIGDAALGSSGEPVDGKSFFPTLKSGGPPAASSALAAASADFLESRDPPEDASSLWMQFTLRTPRWKYLWAPSSDDRVVFDLAADPGELSPLAPGRGEPPEGWDELAAQRRRSRCEPLPESARKRLESLGYIDP